MSDRLTVEPGTLESQLYEIASAVLSKQASEVEKAALYVVSAWHDENISLPNAVGRLACMLEVAGYEIERTVPNPRLEKSNLKVIRQFWEVRENREKDRRYWEARENARQLSRQNSRSGGGGGNGE